MKIATSKNVEQNSIIKNKNYTIKNTDIREKELIIASNTEPTISSNSTQHHKNYCSYQQEEEQQQQPLEYHNNNIYNPYKSNCDITSSGMVLETYGISVSVGGIVGSHHHLHHHLHHPHSLINGISEHNNNNNNSSHSHSNSVNINSNNASPYAGDYAPNTTHPPSNNYNYTDLDTSSYCNNNWQGNLIIRCFISFWFCMLLFLYAVFLRFQCHRMFFFLLVLLCVYLCAFSIYFNFYHSLF